MEKLFGKSRERKESRQEHWVSMSDLMAGLMMVFMLIAVTYLRLIHFERQDVKEIAYAHQESHKAILASLRSAFPESSLQRMHAQINDDLSIEFQAAEFSFDRGSSLVPLAFRDVLLEFFPAYMTVINQHQNNVQEVRIEGHTSSEWGEGELGADESYFRNMELSQGRTRDVLRVCYEMPDVHSYRDWIKGRFVAVGYSSAKLKLDAFGFEDPTRSRRVTFRIITDAEMRIGKIIERFGDGPEN